jgi:SAM-dependent methyltransferase
MSQFDALGETYDRTPTLMQRAYIEFPSMRQAIGDVTGLTVLDLGSGSGVYTRGFAAAGAARVIGIDVSDGMLAAARANDHPENVEYLKRDAAHPNPDGDPALDGRFDLVSSVYVLCYAASPDELTGFFTTARRALASEQGRFVAITVNPEYHRDPAYYSGYDLTLSQVEEADGAPVRLDISVPDIEIHVTLFNWSRAVYERCATKAGFGKLSWTDVTVSPEGVERFGRDFWDDYLRVPALVLLTATA